MWGVSGIRQSAERNVLKGMGQPHRTVSVSMASMYGNEDLSLNVGSLECPTTESISSWAFRRTSGCLITASMKFSNTAIVLKDSMSFGNRFGELFTYTFDAAEV